MFRTIAAVCTLLVAGAFAAAEAATINVGYAIVIADPLDPNNFATLNLAMRTDDYPSNVLYPVLTNVKIIDVWAQLYKGATSFGAPLQWNASAQNPLISDLVYPLANGVGFTLGQGVTRASITFTVDNAGPWDLRDQADFTPTGNLHIAEITNGGADLVAGQNASYVNFAVTGDFASAQIPEPATTLLSIPALGGLFLAVLRRKKI